MKNGDQLNENLSRETISLAITLYMTENFTQQTRNRISRIKMPVSKQLEPREVPIYFKSVFVKAEHILNYTRLFIIC